MKEAVEAVRGDAMPRRRILIIDDDEAFSRSLKLRIEIDGDYECLLASTGVEGLELIKTHKADLVLLDIRMPGIDGLETLTRIKAMAPDLPVAMVTSVRNEQEVKRCFAAGACEYINKPVEFAYLKKTLLVKLAASTNRDT